MHEIITLQLGQYANYVGTHFWNAQEAYFTYDGEESLVDHNVHFRAGVGAGGAETFTPRALIYDLKGGFGTMRKVNALYEELEDGSDSPKPLWDHKTSTHRLPRIEPVQYQKDLEAGVVPPTPLTTSTVRYWSDYNRIYYHPRSSVQLTEYELDSKVQPFEQYDLGKELFRALNREHDLLDRDFRLFAEECDRMDGVQLLTSTDDAWAGFAGEYVEALRDEYGKVGIVSWGLEREEKVARDKQLIRSVAQAKSLTTTASLSSVFVPLRVPLATALGNISIDPMSLWHKAALLSTAIESSFLPTRLDIKAAAGGRLDDLITLLNLHGNQTVAFLSMSANGADQQPADGGSDQRANDPPVYKCLEADRVSLSWPEPEGARLSRPRSDKSDHVFAEAGVTRGFRRDSVPEIDGSSLDRSHRFTVALPFPVVDSFPDVLPTFGAVTPSPQAPTAVRARCAVNTKLSVNSAVTKRIPAMKELAAWGVGIDEREALVNDLEGIVDAYREGWDSDDEWDDDL